jgi:hypothetical protein
MMVSVNPPPVLEVNQANIYNITKDEILPAWQLRYSTINNDISPIRNAHLPRYREDDNTLNLFNSLKTSDDIKEAERF